MNCLAGFLPRPAANMMGRSPFFGRRPGLMCSSQAKPSLLCGFVHLGNWEPGRPPGLQLRASVPSLSPRTQAQAQPASERWRGGSLPPPRKVCVQARPHAGPHREVVGSYPLKGPLALNVSHEASLFSVSHDVRNVQSL